MKHFGKIEKKHFRSTFWQMICIALDCVGLTQSSIIWIIHCNIGLKFFHLLKCLLLSLSFLTFVSQGSVKTHLRCGGIYNNHIIATCAQNVPVKKIFKSVSNWRRYGQK